LRSGVSTTNAVVLRTVSARAVRAADKKFVRNISAPNYTRSATNLSTTRLRSRFLATQNSRLQGAACGCLILLQQLTAT